MSCCCHVLVMVAAHDEDYGDDDFAVAAADDSRDHCCRQGGWWWTWTATAYPKWHILDVPFLFALVCIYKVACYVVDDVAVDDNVVITS
jgi:hypothetical protein